MIRVLIADDHAIVRGGIRRLVQDGGDVQVVGEATSGAEALAALHTLPVDVVLLDIGMPRTSFVDTMRTIREQHPSVHVVVLSAHSEEDYAVRALRAGASAFVTKTRSPEELLDAIRAAASGRRSVSPSIGALLADQAAHEATAPAQGRVSDREREVLRLLGAGHSIAEIGQHLGISAKTASTYRSRLLEKLGLRTTADLIRYAIEHQQT